MDAEESYGRSAANLVPVGLGEILACPDSGHLCRKLAVASVTKEACMSESRTTDRGTSTCGREHFPLASPMLDDPRPFYARARREEPVFWSESLGLWVVTRYDDVCAVAKDVVHFSSLDSITPGTVPPPPELVAELVKGFPLLPSLVDSDPPVHTRGRGIVTKARSLRRLAA